MFCKEAAVAIWYSGVLAERTVTRMLKNRTKTECKLKVFLALTPQKLAVLHGKVYFQFMIPFENVQFPMTL